MRLHRGPARVISIAERGLSRLTSSRNQLEAARLALTKAIEAAMEGLGDRTELEQRADLYAEAIRRHRWELISSRWL
jgi:hypothetical protein